MKRALAELGPFALLAAAALVLGARWDEIPVTFPIHWNIHGRPDGWATRGFWGAFGPLLLGAVTAGGLAGVRFALRALSRQPRTPRGAAMRALSDDAMLLGEYALAAPFAAGAGLPFGLRPGALGAIALGSVLFFLAALTVLLAAGAKRIARLPPEGDEPPGWKSVLVYANRADPALFVPKRCGVGHTINFGHRLAWPVLALIVAPCIAIAVIAILVTR